MAFIQTRLTTEGLRHYNRAMVLGALRRSDSLSHTEISAQTGLASGTVSAITGEFLEEGVLTKVEKAPPSGRGRPRVLFVTRADLTQILLIRVSVAEVALSLVDYAGKMQDRRVLQRGGDTETVEEFSETLKRTALDFISRSKLTPADIPLISVTTKGEVNEREGVLIWSPVFGKHRLDFAEVFADWNADVTLSHQTGLMAHNLLSQAADKAKVNAGDRLAVLSLGDSIGLGLAHVNARGEIEYSAPGFGHMTHQADGPLCRCGAKGCLETFAGFYGILRTALDGPTDFIQSKYVPPAQMAHLADKARNGDRAAILAFRDAGVAIGMGLSRIFSVLGPMPVKVTGAGLPHYDLLADGVLSQIEQSFSVRMDHQPEIGFEQDEVERSHDSNVFGSLMRLDETQIATRRIFEPA